MSIPLLKSGLPQDQTAATMGLLGGHDLIFLGLSMAAGKPIADPARDIPFCTGVTAMARNGTEFGIQVSGLEASGSPPCAGSRWPVLARVQARRRRKGYWGLSHHRDGRLGWVRAWGSDGVLSFVGGTPEEASDFGRQMRQTAIGQSPDYLIPPLGFEGTSIGIDIRKVVQTGTLPIIDTAMGAQGARTPDCRCRACARPHGVFQEGTEAVR